MVGTSPYVPKLSGGSVEYNRARSNPQISADLIMIFFYQPYFGSESKVNEQQPFRKKL